MLGQVMRVKRYYDIMIHKNHSECVYGLIDLRLGWAHLKGKFVRFDPSAPCSFAPCSLLPVILEGHAWASIEG